MPISQVEVQASRQSQGAPVLVGTKGCLFPTKAVALLRGLDHIGVPSSPYRVTKQDLLGCTQMALGISSISSPVLAFGLQIHLNEEE